MFTDKNYLYWEPRYASHGGLSIVETTHDFTGTERDPCVSRMSANNFLILCASHSFRFWENAIVLDNHYATTG